MEQKKKILVVDDYEESCRLLTEILADDYETAYTSDSTKAFAMIGEFRPDLVVLDYRMPGLLGADVCKLVRDNETTKYIPVVFVSGEANLEERINAFETGADDFISKPFHVKELLLRIKRLTHREPETVSEIVAANLKMKLLARRVYVEGEEVQLTPKQFDILKLLVSHKNALVSREKFLDEIWGDTEVTLRNVDSQINYLKKKISKFTGKITAVPSMGYRLEL